MSLEVTTEDYHDRIHHSHREIYSSNLIVYDKVYCISGINSSNVGARGRIAGGDS